MFNSLIENKSIWNTDFSLQEAVFIEAGKIMIFCTCRKNFQLKIWKCFLKSDSQVECYYYHLCFTDGKLNARTAQNLTENTGGMSEIWKEGENNRSHLVPKYSAYFRPLPVSHMVTRSLSYHFLFGNITLSADTIFRNHHAKTLAMRLKSSHII